MSSAITERIADICDLARLNTELVVMALRRGRLDLLLGEDVDLLLAVRITGEEVPDPVEQPLLLRVHVGLAHVQRGGLEPGAGKRDGDRRAVRGDLDRLAFELREVHERDIGALPDEQGLAALQERRQEGS